MKFSRCSNEIFGVPPQMKSNPPFITCRQVDFIAERFHSAQAEFIPQQADLVKKHTFALQTNVCFFGGDGWDRTNDLMHVKHAL